MYDIPIFKMTSILTQQVHKFHGCLLRVLKTRIARGFGFIARDDLPNTSGRGDVFLHFSDLDGRCEVFLGAPKISYPRISISNKYPTPLEIMVLPKIPSILFTFSGYYDFGFIFDGLMMLSSCFPSKFHQYDSPSYASFVP